MKGIDCKFILNLMMKTSLNFKRFSSLKVFYFTVDSNKENFRQKYMKFENDALVPQYDRYLPQSPP